MCVLVPAGPSGPVCSACAVGPHPRMSFLCWTGARKSFLYLLLFHSWFSKSVTWPGTGRRGGWSFWGRGWRKSKAQDKQTETEHNPEPEAHFSLGNAARSFHNGWAILSFSFHSYSMMGGLWPLLLSQSVHQQALTHIVWSARVWRAVGRGTCVWGVGIFLCFIF